MNQTAIHRVAIGLLLLGSLQAAFSSRAPGVEIRHNPADPPARASVRLNEIWRVGGDEDADILLGQVGAAVSGPQGEVYALDSQLAQVLVFDAAGRLLRVLGREGEGPGEFRRPTGLYLAGAEGLAVMQTFPGRLIYLDRRTAEPQGQWTLGRDDPQAGGFGILQAARERGGVRAVSAGLSSFDMAAGTMRGTQYLALLDQAGQERRRLAEQVSSRDLARQVRDELADHFAGARGLWDLGPDGRLYLVPQYDRYAIRVHGPDGEVLHEFSREHVPRLRTDEEKAQQRESMNMNIGGRQVAIEWKQQDHARCIEHLQALDDGSLCVINSHGRARWESHGERIYDVFDRDGRLQREVTVTVPEGGRGNRLILLDDGRFLLIKGMDTMSIMVGFSTSGTTSGMVGPQDPGDVMLELICYEALP